MSNWPGLLRRIQTTGARDEIQRLLEQFLVLSERNTAGMEQVFELFRRTMIEWEDQVVARSLPPRASLRLVTRREAEEQGRED